MSKNPQNGLESLSIEKINYFSIDNIFSEYVKVKHT